MRVKKEQYAGIVDGVWHFRVEDGLDWEFCAGVWNQDTGDALNGGQVKRAFLGYFRDLCGIEPYSACPVCGCELVPRKSGYGRFVGCSGYPKCRFMATKTKPYVLTAMEIGRAHV